MSGEVSASVVAGKRRWRGEGENWPKEVVTASFGQVCKETIKFVCHSMYGNIKYKDASQTMADEDNRPRCTSIELSFCAEICDKSMGVVQNSVRGATSKERRRISLISEREDACLKVFVGEQVAEPQASSLWVRPCIYPVLIEPMNRNDTNAD